MASEMVAGDQPADPGFLASLDFKALYEKTDMSKLEKAAKSYGVHRRVFQALLASDKDEILARVDDPEKSADTFFSMLELAKEYKEHLAGLKEQVEAAEARILCVLSSICLEEKGEEGGREK